MAQSSCKRDTKSKSHPGMKLAPVRVFSCKHPLTRDLSIFVEIVLFCEELTVLEYNLHFGPSETGYSHWCNKPVLWNLQGTRSNLETFGGKSIDN